MNPCYKGCEGWKNKALEYCSQHEYWTGCEDEKVPETYAKCMIMTGCGK